MDRPNVDIYQRRTGAIGGIVSTFNHTDQQRRARSAVGGNALVRRYGNGYFRAIAKKGWADSPNRITRPK